MLVHMPAAFNLALLLLRSHADAEDALQDAVVRAWRAYHQLRDEAAKPWLLAIVRNVSFRRLHDRRRGGNVISLDEALLVGSPNEYWMMEPQRSPEDAAVMASDRALLMRALNALPIQSREILVLREIEELSYAAIAEIIGAPAGTVMSRLSRARDSLREALRQLLKEGDSHAV